MKMRIASLSALALCLTLAAIPLVAQTIYSNGPVNGNTDAWNFGDGYIVSDAFTVSGSPGGPPAARVGNELENVWLEPGDTLMSAELSITSGENSGTSYFDQTVNYTQSNCVMNNFGYDVCLESTTFNGPTLNNGTYWLNLQNAVVSNGGVAYWDENSGPSLASENDIGSIPSESFTLLGSSSTSTTTSVPEPSSIMLFGSGIFGLAGLLRRRLF